MSFFLLYTYFYYVFLFVYVVVVVVVYVVAAAVAAVVNIMKPCRFPNFLIWSLNSTQPQFHFKFNIVMGALSPSPL